MSEPLQYPQQLALLGAHPAQLRQQVQQLSEPAYRFRPAEGEWSVIENVGHLIDIDILMRARIGKIMASNNPPLEPFDVDGTVRAREYQQKNLMALLHAFAEQRAEFLEQIRYLRPEALERAGIHPTRGAVRIADLVGMVLRNDAIHTEQIANTIAAFR
jgi:DinB superfamily